VVGEEGGVVDTALGHRGGEEVETLKGVLLVGGRRAVQLFTTLSKVFSNSLRTPTSFVPGSGGR